MIALDRRFGKSRLELGRAVGSVVRGMLASPAKAVMESLETRTLLSAVFGEGGATDFGHLSAMGAASAGFVLSADATDSNDQISEARDLGAVGAPPVSVEWWSVDPATDVDMLGFSATSGQRVAIDLDRLSGGLDSYVRVFDAAGNEIASNDNGAAPGEGASSDSYLMFTASSSGAYYVGVSAAGNDSYDAVTGLGDGSASTTGRYSLIISEVQTSDNDPNDQISEARDVGSVGSSPIGVEWWSVNPATDVDIVAFSATIGQRVAVDVDRVGGGLDSYIRVFDAAGNEIAANDNGAAPGEGASSDSYLTFTASSTGDYYVGVSGAGNESYDPVGGLGDNSASTGRYTLIISEVQTSDPDSNDQISEARDLGAVGASPVGVEWWSINPTGSDVDVFSFDVAAGQRVSFDVDRPTGGLDSYLRLFDATGNEIENNDNGAAPGEPLGIDPILGYLFNTGGTYYVGISASGNSSYDPITGLGDGSGNTGRYNLTLTAAGTGAGSFDITGPSTAVADTTPTITWHPSSSAASYDLAVATDAAGTSVVQSYPGMTETSFELTSPLSDGTYYTFVVANNGSGSTPAGNNGLEFSISEPSIDTVYFAQTHVQKPSNPYFTLVSNRDALIKAHVVAPGSPLSPDVTATLTLGGQTLVLPLTGPGTLPASIPDGPGVVQHSFDDSFTATIPAEWMHPDLDITVTADTASMTYNNLDIGAPTVVEMNMFDVQYFADTNHDYPPGTLEELEAKWPVADLNITRIPHVVFPELVIPARGGAPAVRVASPGEYLEKTGIPFDGEQAAALAWNGALKRAAGRDGRVTLSYINIYGVSAGGQAGGFAGVGSGTAHGILHHELGHALSLPHWANASRYPYKGDMHGIPAPDITDGTHAGPTWAYDPATQTFIPPTTQPGNVRNHPVGTYKADPMQGGGYGFNEPEFLLNHFSDYSVWEIQDYLERHVVLWNDSLNSYASWDQGDADYTNTVSNNGVQYPIERDVEVISVMASVFGADPDVNMVYPPIGPYEGDLIKLFDPRDPADRADADAIFSPSGGSDVSLRIIQGGVEKIYMLAASYDGSLRTEAVNLPAADGEVTRVDLLSTPNAERNGLPANPEVLYTWSQVRPDPAAFEVAPTAGSSTAVTMRAVEGVSTGAPVEYLFTETTGNPGATSSGWQSSPSYTDDGLQAGTQYAYTVTMRAGSYSGQVSDPVFVTTNGSGLTETITIDSTQQFELQDGGGLQAVTNLGDFDASGSDKLVVVVSTEHAWNNGNGFVNEVRYNGVSLTEAVQEDAGADTGVAAIFYLDDPGAIGSGTIEVSAENPNGGIGAVYALSGTAPGVGITNSATGSAVTSVNLTTVGDNSLVIAVIDNAGGPNGAGVPTFDGPVNQQVSSGSWGGSRQWGGHASGFIQVGGPSTVTPSFNTNTGSEFSINVAAVEILAAPLAGSPVIGGSFAAADASSAVPSASRVGLWSEVAVALEGDDGEALGWL